jgi:uncharacterized protein (AIM24 family)
MMSATDAGTPSGSVYVCPYCRTPSDATAPTCPNCGAPIDVRQVVSTSGWEELPRIRDLARIQFGQSTCQVSGKYVPVADMRLAEGDSVYFSHHVLLYADPTVQMTALSMGKGWDRTLAGMPLIMMQATGPGNIAFSEDKAGETVAVPLEHGQAVEVHEHRFLAATSGVSYTWQKSGIWYNTIDGNDQKTHRPMGRYLDRFESDGRGLLLLHAQGNVFLRDIPEGEQILVQPGAVLYKDPSVGMQLHLEFPDTSSGGGGGLGGLLHSVAGSFSNRVTPWLRMWGPGRVAIQSVYAHPKDADGPIGRTASATSQHW